jgi:hypothetical protein
MDNQFNLMSGSETSSNNETHLKKIVGLAIEDESFCNSFLSNPTEAINSEKIGFDYEQLSDEVKGILPTFTREELDTLRRIHARASKVGVTLKPTEML